MKELGNEKGKPAPKANKGASVQSGLSEQYDCGPANNSVGPMTETAKQKPAMSSAGGKFEFKGN